MDGETLISAEHLSRWYGNRLAIDDISFALKRGEVLGFLGPNGAGKTTTMRILCGALAASSGSVSICGRDIVEEPGDAKRHIGYLPEDPPLYDDLSVDQYLAYCARLRGIGGDRLRDAVANSRQRCGLEEVKGRLIGNLSRGYQQRVGIAQAIIHSPAALVLDEPTVGLDPAQIIEIRELIRELADGHGVILSTHILPEAQTTCDRVIIIHRGRLLVDQPLNALRQDSGERHFTIALRYPPVPEELESANAIREVQPLDRNRFRITCAAGESDAAAELAELAVRSGWGLYELVPEVGTLEETFLRVTHDDAVPSADTAA